MVERQRAARRHRQRGRVVGLADAGAGEQQFLHAGAGAGGAHEIAIDLGQRAERAGDDGGGEHEGGDGAAGQPARDDVERALPQHQGDGAEDQRDDDRGHAGAQPDAALGGVEGGFDRGAEPCRLAVFLGKGLDDLDGAEHLGDHRTDAGDAILAGFRHVADPAPEPDDRQDGDRDDQQHQRSQFRRLDRHIGDATDAHHGVAQRHRGARRDDLFDDCGVAGQPRGNLGGAVFFKEHRIEGQQMRLYGLAQIGDDALADPADEIEPERRGDAHQHDDAEHAPEIRGDRAGVRALGKAVVDDQLQPLRDRQRGQRRDDQRGQRGGNLAGIGPGKAPKQDEAAQLALLGRRQIGFCGHGG